MNISREFEDNQGPDGFVHLKFPSAKSFTSTSLMHEDEFTKKIP